MDIRFLKQRYEEVKDTDDYDQNMAFIKLLMSSNEPDVMEFHYSLLAKRKNRDFYLRLRAAFVKRGEAGAKFLVQQMKTEKDSEMRADILHLLGRMGDPNALPLARQAIQSPDPDLRDRACYVLGWIGEEDDIDLLRDRLLNDPKPKVRADAATAHDQIKDQVPRSKNKLLKNLRDGLLQEKDPKVTGWIVVTVQYIMNKKFGMKEDIEEAALEGNVPAAKRKCLEALEKLKL